MVQKKAEEVRSIEHLESAGMPSWERVTWASWFSLMVVFAVFWLPGWSRPPFPV